MAKTKVIAVANQKGGVGKALYGDMVVQNFPLYCTKCKTEVRVDIMQLKMTVSK